MNSPERHQPLSSKVVVITGCGRGLGRALVEAFIQEGASVVGIGHRKESVEDVATLVSSDRFLPIVADVADAQAVEHAFQRAIETFKRVDILFNNAAIYPKVDFTEQSADAWARTISINVNGVANCCRSVLPHMISAGYGRIFNVGSFAHLGPIQGSTAYSVSKGAVHVLTKSLAQETMATEADLEIHEWVPGHLNTRMSDFTGIDPKISAKWAVKLASMPHARTRNCVFENDHEWLPAEGIRARIKRRLLFWKAS